MSLEFNQYSSEELCEFYILSNVYGSFSSYVELVFLQRDFMMFKEEEILNLNFLRLISYKFNGSKTVNS